MDKFLNMRLFYDYSVISKAGELIKYEADEAHSFVQGFLLLLYRQWASNSYAGPTMIVTSGSPDTSCDGFSLTAGVGISYYGTQVGSGNTATAIDDYSLETLLVHGTGANQVQYSAVSYTAPISDVTTTRFTITRDFTNGSGSSIDVNEIGLVSNSNGLVLLARDILTTPATLGIGEKLVLNYTIQTEI